MFWTDRIVEKIEVWRKDTTKPLIVRDEKTMSGRAHVGSMRSVAVHALVSEVLTEHAIENSFKYEFNDFDPFDSIPPYLDASFYKEYLGKPLYTVPSPELGFENYAEYFSAEFITVHKKAGFYPSYYRATGLYRSGVMDPYIKTALERVADVRRILKEISGSEKDDTWLPISVVCEKCGKIMTTRAYDFDGKTVAYACDKKITGITSCGHTGRLSPFSGGSKLFWKVDWAAKWGAIGVGVEGGGKDHSTKGGARDVSNHIAREIFGEEPPFDTPYEFFLIGGKKMSSSKGSGSSAKDMADLLPTQIFRLLLIGKDVREQISIDPKGDSIPRLYDWYDKLAEHARNGDKDDYARLYALCTPPKEREALTTPWQMRFSEVAFLVQMPHLSLHKEAKKSKGSTLNSVELDALEERAEYARLWLMSYAPEKYRFVLQKEMPKTELSDIQKKAISSLYEFMQEGEKTGDAVHSKLHTLKEEIPITPKELFSALYRVFLDRDSGPKAGWFLSVLPHDFVLKRLKEAY